MVVIAFPGRINDLQRKAVYQPVNDHFVYYQPTLSHKHPQEEISKGKEMDEQESADAQEEVLIPGNVGTAIQLDIQALLKKFNIGADEAGVRFILRGWRAVVAPRLHNMVITDLHYLAQPGYIQVISGLRQGFLPDFVLGLLVNNGVDLSHLQFVVMERRIYRGKSARATDWLYLCSLRRPRMALDDLQALRELGPPNSSGARANGQRCLHVQERPGQVQKEVTPG